MRTSSIPSHGISLPSLSDTKTFTRPPARTNTGLAPPSIGLHSRRVSADASCDVGRRGEYRPGTGLRRAQSASGGGSTLFVRRKRVGSRDDGADVDQHELRVRQAASASRLYAGIPTTTNKPPPFTLPRNLSTRVNTKQPIHYKDNASLPSYTLSDFYLFRTLTRDPFSRTSLASLKSDIQSACTFGTFSPSHAHADQIKPPPTYAIKIFRKTDVVQRKLLARVLRERDVLRRVKEEMGGAGAGGAGFGFGDGMDGRARFVVEILCTFQDNEKLYLVTGYGGSDLREVVKTRRRLDEDSARFYTAEITMALEFLHEKNIIFRDLKPESVLIDHEGHVKLCDFGLAKILSERDGGTSTFCGSPGYMAPEILTKSHYTPTADWWSLGILLHELLLNDVPFGRDPSPLTTLSLIAPTTHSPLPLPDMLSPTARDLIRRLLQPLPRERLGGWHGSEDVKCHAWFRGVIKAWRAVSERCLRPPFVPGIDGEVMKCIERRLVAMGAGVEDEEELKAGFEKFRRGYEEGEESGDEDDFGNLFADF